MIERKILYAGDTLRVSGQYLDASLQPKSLGGVAISAQVQILTETKACAIQITDLILAEFDIYVAASATVDWPRGVWALTVSYEWIVADAAQHLTEQLALIEVRSKV